MAKILISQCCWYLVKNLKICWVFCNFSDFQIGKTQSSQEFSTWDHDNSIFIVVYFKGYFSRICTFVHFPEIFNFVQFSQHICQYAEFLSSYHAKEIKYQNLYAKIQIFLFMQNVCKHNVHSTIRGFSLLYNWPFLGLSVVWNSLFLHFSTWNYVFSIW